MSEPLNELEKTKQRTLFLIKPDAVRRCFVGEIMQRINAQDGLHIIKSETILATREQCLRHYAKDDAWCIKYGQKKIDQGLAREGLTALEAGCEILELMADYMTSGEMVAMIVDGDNAIERMVALVGPTEPASAPIRTLRRDFGDDSYEIANGENRALHNVAHCSDSPEEAEREIGIWFPEFDQKAA